MLAMAEGNRAAAAILGSPGCTGVLDHAPTLLPCNAPPADRSFELALRLLVATGDIW
jgi:hypothetical protein